MSFEQRIKRSRLFILGAGFSAGAGIPLTDELLQRAMALFARESPGLHARVENYAKECIGSHDDVIDYATFKFSDLCTYLEYVELREHGGGERFCDGGSREKIGLRFYLAKTLVERTPRLGEISRVYLDFAAQLHEGDIVISFNWDGLLENSLDKLGMNYTYDFDDPRAIKLCKLHGSVNWRLGEGIRWPGSRELLAWQSLGFDEGMLKRKIYYASDLLDYSTWQCIHPFGEVDPFLVLPGFGKAYDVRANATLWYKPEFAFASTHDVYIIGVGLPEDDFFVRSLFLSNLPFIESYSGIDGRKIFVINPDVELRTKYDFLSRNSNVVLLQECFVNKHVDLMKQRLSES